MVNVFFLWSKLPLRYLQGPVLIEDAVVPLAGIYTATACVSCWWHHHNDQGSGSQKGNVAFAVIPLLFLELAGPMSVYYTCCLSLNRLDSLARILHVSPVITPFTFY